MAEKIKIYRWKYTETDNSNDGVFNGYLQVDYAPHIVPFSYLTEIDPTMELKGKITKVELSMVFLRNGSSKVSVDTKFSLSNSRGESYESDGWVTTSGITNTVTPTQFFPMTNPPPISFFSAKDYTLKIEHRNATRSEIVSPSGNFVDLRIFYEETTIPVSSITLSSTSLTLIEGGTQTLTATVYPDSATNKKLSWSSDNHSVATVDSNGKVTAVSAGSATITCAAEDGSGKYATCSITVKSQIVIVEITSISLNKTSITLKKGNSTDLSYTPNPSNASIESVRWVSKNPSIASVSNNGKVTALNPGEAEISCYVTDKKGKEVSASCLVDVIETDVPPETSAKHVYININGTYVPAVAWIKIGGTWKECTTVYVNKNGNWYKANAK